MFFDHIPIESFNCHKCPLNTNKQKLNNFTKKDSNLILSQSVDDFKYLIVTDIPPTDFQLKILKEHLHNHNIFSYDIYSAIRCEIDSFDDVPIHETFQHCQSKYDYSKYTAVLTIGRGMFSVLENTDDFSSWTDFVEYIFNQTYFYTPIYYPVQIPVFPLPQIKFLEHAKTDSFDGWFIDHQFNKANICRTSPAFRFKPVQTTVIDNPNEWLQNHINTDPIGALISLDTETNDINVYTKDFQIGIVIISYDDKSSNILRFKDIDLRLFEKYLDRLKLIGANTGYDIRALVRCGVNRDCLHIADDIILLHHMLNTQISKLSLKTQSWFLGAGGYDKDLEDYKHKYSNLLMVDLPEPEYKVVEYFWDQNSDEKQSIQKPKRKLNYLKIPENILFKYAGFDSALTFRRRNMLLQNSQTSVIQAYYEILPALDTFIDMEIDGVPFDRDEAVRLIDLLQKEMAQLNLEIKQYFENEYDKKKLNKSIFLDFDIASDEKLSKVIETLKWEKYILTDSGRVSTGEENLIYWKQDGHTIVDKILDYRGKASLCNTHLTGWLNAISDYDGVVHPSVGMALANTLRCRHSKPNSGNIPAHGESAKLIRPLYFKDQIIFEYDYSGFQLRIMTEYSQDETLLNVYRNDGDLHSTTGAYIFHNGMDEKEFEKFAKDEIEPYATNRFKSKCFIKGTKIVTSRGSIPIEDFIPEINEGLFTPYLENDIQIVDRYGNNKRIDSTYFGITNELIDIELANGDIISVTPDHEFPIKRDSLELKVKAKDLLDADELIDL